MCVMWCDNSGFNSTNVNNNDKLMCSLGYFLFNFDFNTHLVAIIFYRGASLHETSSNLV